VSLAAAQLSDDVARAERTRINTDANANPFVLGVLWANTVK